MGVMWEQTTKSIRRTNTSVAQDDHEDDNDIINMHECFQWGRSLEVFFCGEHSEVEDRGFRRPKQSPTLRRKS